MPPFPAGHVSAPLARVCLAQAFHPPASCTRPAAGISLPSRGHPSVSEQSSRWGTRGHMQGDLEQHAWHLWTGHKDSSPESLNLEAFPNTDREALSSEVTASEPLQTKCAKLIVHDLDTHLKELILIGSIISSLYL